LFEILLAKHDYTQTRRCNRVHNQPPDWLLLTRVCPVVRASAQNVSLFTLNRKCMYHHAATGSYLATALYICSHKQRHINSLWLPDNTDNTYALHPRPDSTIWSTRQLSSISTTDRLTTFNLWRVGNTAPITIT